MKFSKRLVQPPHYLVTCAHHKSFSIYIGTFMQLIMYICLRFPTLSVAQNVLNSSLCNSLTPQNLRSLVHRIGH